MICSIKNKIIQEIVNGNPVILPTETVYGIGVRYDKQDSIDQVFQIKKRDLNKPISLHITKNMLDMFEIPKNLHNLCDKLFPGPFTLLIPYNERHGFHSKSKFTGKIGIRVPDNKIFQEILDITQMPLCMTSANISAFGSKAKFAEIDLSSPDIIGIEDDEHVFGTESIIIDATTNPMMAIRT